MIRALGSILALLIAGRSSAQTTEDFVSPCPNVFSYDLLAAESNKWFGVVNLTTDTPLYSLWLNIVLDNKANILGNWLGEVTTNDNVDFKIENTNMTITPEEPLAVRFFIQYNIDVNPPKLRAIRFNGREICPVAFEVPAAAVPAVPTLTTVRPTLTTISRNSNQNPTTVKTTTNSGFSTQTTPKPTTTTLKQTEAPTASTLRTQQTQFWQQTTPTLKPILYWTPAKTEVNPQTTVKTPAQTFVQSASNQQVTPTLKPTNQSKSQIRTETSTRITTENNLVSGQVQNSPYPQANDRNKTTYSQGQVPNYQQTTPANKYQIQNDVKQETTDTVPSWPNLKVADNQNVSSKTTSPNNFQIEVKQVGNTKYWSKIPENTTGLAVKTNGTETTTSGWSGNQQTVSDRELLNQPDAKKSIKQSESTPNLDQPGEPMIYVRPEDRQTVSDKSKNHVENIPQPYSGIGSDRNNQPTRPADSYQQTTFTDEVRPLKITGQDSVQGYGEDNQPWAEPERNATAAYPTNDGRIKNKNGSDLSSDKFHITTEPSFPAPNNNAENFNYRPEDYYSGGLPVFYIPNFGPLNTAEPTCGKVLLNKEIPPFLKSTGTVEGQWPWQVAIYQQQVSVELHYKYICGGTLVSRRHIITAAHCVTRRLSVRVVNKDSLAVFLGKQNLRYTIEGVQLKFVCKILIYPDYDPTVFKTDLAILELHDSVSYSYKVQPACLWPEQDTDIQTVVGQTGSTVGWGYEVTGVPREELTLLQMEVVDQQTCLGSYAALFSKFTSDKTYCAAYRNSDTTCNGDSGGGMVFQKGSSWYLRGVVSLSVARQGAYQCDPNHYVIFTDVAKFLPWIQDNIEDYV